MDIALYETYNGGDISIQDNDIYNSSSLWLQIYLALFGGNYEAVTDDNVAGNSERYDYWGNSLLNDSDEWMNSITERTLNEVSLNSAGRLTIQRAVETDLNYLTKIGNITVNVSILDIDKVEIYITIQEPDSVESKQYRILWIATKAEDIGGGIGSGGIVGGVWMLNNGVWDDNGLWLDFETWFD